MQNWLIKTFSGGICVRKLPRIWILDPLGPFGTLGPYLKVVFWTPWALLGPLDPIMSDFYETLLFWGKQEAFWKGRKLSGKAGSFWGKSSSSHPCLLVPMHHEASDGPHLGPLGPLAQKSVPKLGPFSTNSF